MMISRYPKVLPSFLPTSDQTEVFPLYLGGKRRLRLEGSGQDYLALGL